MYDITQSQNHLAALYQTADCYRVVIEQAPDGIFLYDANTKQVLQANPAYRNLLGYTLEEILGLTLDDIAVDDSASIDCTFEHILREKHSLIREQKHRHKDGSLVDVSVSFSLFSYGGRGVVCSFVRDITSLKQVQETYNQILLCEQAARKQLEAANQAKDEFLAVLSHELRNPLNAMLGWVQLLRTQKLDEVKCVQALSMIERSVKSQAKLVDDLLDISRIINGKLRLHVRQVNLAPAIAGAIDTIHSVVTAKAIRLESILSSSPVFVLADPDRLQQIIWNLLSNAIKFTPEGGRVLVRLARTDSQAQIQVSDTGEGISADFLPYVFDRFCQGEDSMSNNGLGLGLAIVRHLVELHNGTVQVDSPGKNQGATFTVNLPLMPMN